MPPGDQKLSTDGHSKPSKDCETVRLGDWVVAFIEAEGSFFITRKKGQGGT